MLLVWFFSSRINADLFWYLIFLKNIRFILADN